MALRFLADHCIPKSVVRKLIEAGHSVFALRDVAPQESPDEAVIAKAQELHAILVSLNGDFADIVAYPPSRYGGIIALQAHNHPEVLPWLLRGGCHTQDRTPEIEHYRGKLIVISVNQIRIRE